MLGRPSKFSSGVLIHCKFSAGMALSRTVLHARHIKQGKISGPTQGKFSGMTLAKLAS